MSANIKKIHDIIRCALNQAIRWEYLDSKMRNPASLATLPKVPKVKRKVWNVQTFKEAIKLVDDDLLLLCMHIMSPIGIFLFYWTNLAYIMKILTV